MHSHSSSQPRSSLYLWEEDQRESQEPCTLELHLCPRTEQTHMHDSQNQAVLLIAVMRPGQAVQSPVHGK